MKKLIVTLFLPLFSLAFECTVEHIIDGDTFICSGSKIRLIGVDTPESKINKRAYKQTNLGDIRTVVRLGKIAKKFTESLIPPGTKVKLEFDVQKRDRYGRILAYVYLPDGRMLNEVLLKEGYAMLLTIPPNVKYEYKFKKAYREAVSKKKGLWSQIQEIENSSESNKGFICGTKKYCREMTSCEEAMYYYKVCGLKKLDRNRNGIPCERICK